MSRKDFSIFDYSSVRQLMLDYLSYRQKTEPKFSVRSWAKELGIGSHALLIMLLQGKRPFRLKHVPTIASGLKLSSAERLYLQALIQLESAQSAEEKQLCSLWLSELNPGMNFVSKELDEFIAISHWTYTAILMLTETQGFRYDEAEICRRLRKKVSPIEVRSAVQRMLGLKLLVHDESGRLKATFNRLSTRDDVANEGAKKYHRSTIEAASEALDLPLDRREFQSFSMAMRRDKIPLAKEMIRKFRSQFVKAVGAESDGDEVFQMCIQFFQLTESPEAMVAFEDEGVGAGSRSQSKENRNVVM
jgi:uncharacterized protein (TIGR02147 family)